MSSSYAGSVTYPSTITIVDDGDPANAAHFNPGPMGLADRTAYLKSHVDTLEAGVKRIFEVVDTIALRAVTAHADGDWAMVANGTGADRWARFSATSTAADDDISVYKPNNIPSGPGRWLVWLNSSRIAPLDSPWGKVVIANLPHGVVDKQRIALSGNAPGSATTTIATYTASSVSGDIVTIVGSVGSDRTIGNQAFLKLVATGTTGPATMLFDLGVTSGGLQVPFAATYVANATSISVAIQVWETNGASLAYSNGSLVGTVTRA